VDTVDSVDAVLVVVDTVDSVVLVVVDVVLVCPGNANRSSTVVFLVVPPWLIITSSVQWTL